MQIPSLTCGSVWTCDSQNRSIRRSACKYPRLQSGKGLCVLRAEGPPLSKMLYPGLCQEGLGHRELCGQETCLARFTPDRNQAQVESVQECAGSRKGGKKLLEYSCQWEYLFQPITKLIELHIFHSICTMPSEIQ
jgi:hypothetical protein